MHEIEDRCIGMRAIGFETGAGERDESHLARLIHQRVRETRLADARFAGEERGAAVRGVRTPERECTGLERHLPSDEKRAHNVALAEHRQRLLRCGEREEGHLSNAQ